GSIQDQIGCAIARTAVDINDGRALAGKPPQNAILDSTDRKCDSIRIIMGGKPDQDVDFSDAHQLTDTIVAKKAFFRQFDFGANGGGAIRSDNFVWHGFYRDFLRRSDSSQTEPVKLIWSQ